MTIEEARKLYEKYKREIHWDHDPANEDALIEITEFLVKETGDPWYTSDLGAYYYGEKKYDLALKYYEKTYELGDREISTCLGYIWYYGRTGTVDYEKAFRYYSEAAQLGETGAKRKLADMYHHGFFVEKNEETYRRMIEELYEQHKDDEYSFIELPGICTRLAAIRAEEGKTEEAVNLYLRAKEDLAVSLRYNGFFGDINVMEWLVNDLYALIPVDYSDLDVFDLFYLLKEPNDVSFRYQRKKYRISSFPDEGRTAVRFEGCCYRSVNDLFQKAKVSGKPFYALSREIYDVEVNHGRDH